ncbi:rhomboid family integral membrane protein, putative [Theileria annulata]|uniref:Rhomboid family integral membrane protein, putative n=1 Tax=Theileria annulata TaxID=5874 RepID=Q4UGW3_THEAN|nr:rhomboid family integral membrane protein, putative [Theileria annulata]CAI73676.1 rhomboid family integral membrane protein, putative [Theileria annulata]|eukprot:XP_954353.1 rhomboid family integral membrane protein, putative [Theileria annulata]
MEDESYASTSVIDMSNVDYIENMFEKLVSRQNRFTKEFENNIEICCTQLNKLKDISNSDTINLLSSLYNSKLTVERLKLLQNDYEPCSVCKTVEHAPLIYKEDLKEKIRKRSTDQSDDYFQFMTRTKSFKNTRFFFDFKGEDQSNDPDKIKKEASNSFHEHKFSDYFVFLINERPSTDTIFFKKFTFNSLKSLGSRALELIMSFFPIFNITNFSNLIIVIQWFLYILRVLVLRNIFKDKDIESESKQFGAFSGQLLRDNLEIHRILTSTFFHNSFAHLVISTMMHLRFSSVFEMLNGILATIFVYLSSSAYGMIGVCWLTPDTLQASGFAGDWGVAGALLSRFFMFPFLVHREYQNITNIVVSYICLFFLKTIGKGSSILVLAHLLSAISGLCMGTMINMRSKTNKISGIKRLLTDFVCSCTLLVVPIFSIFMLFTVK